MWSRPLEVTTSSLYRDGCLRSDADGATKTKSAMIATTTSTPSTATTTSMMTKGRNAIGADATGTRRRRRRQQQSPPQPRRRRRSRGQAAGGGLGRIVAVLAVLSSASSLISLILRGDGGDGLGFEIGDGMYPSVNFFFAEAFPNGYRQETFTHVHDALSLLTVPKFEGGTALWVIRKDGIIKAFQDPDNSKKSHTVVDISKRVCDNLERGLLSAAVHPDFSKKRPYVYLYYNYDKRGGCKLSYKNGPSDRVSRFEVSSEYKIKTNTEKVIFETTPQGMAIHNGGDVEFGHDGYLYVTVGDGGARPNFEAQDRGILLGKLLRFTDNGGIPKSNPFVNNPKAVSCKATGKAPKKGGICEEIFALGLRNPFRFSLNPNRKGRTQFFISDVGRGTWEEINEAGDGFKGANYGWMIREGPCAFGSKTHQCDPIRHVKDKGYTDPTHYYEHKQRTAKGGSAIVGGAFPPDDARWPVPAGTYLFADYVLRTIYMITPNSNPKGCRTCKQPESDWKTTVFHKFDNDDRPVTFRFVPYKKKGQSYALYYTCRVCKGNIRRIIYEGKGGGGGGGNRSPVAVATVDPSFGDVDTVFRFDGADSYDPEGRPLSYRWDFGDGNKSTKKNPTHRYSKTGSRRVKLIVTDKEGKESSDTLDVAVGKPPKIVIESPPKGTTFAVGDKFTLRGRAEEANGNEIPPKSLTWEVRQHHNTHYHEWLGPTSGSIIKSVPPAPRPEDFNSALNSYLEVRLTARTSSGISYTVSRNVMPRVVYLNFGGNPSKSQISVDGYIVTTPLRVAFWENEVLHLEARKSGGGGGAKFEGWSGGGFPSQFTGNDGKKKKSQFRVRPSDRDTKITAQFAGGGGGGGGGNDDNSRIIPLLFRAGSVLEGKSADGEDGLQLRLDDGGRLILSQRQGSGNTRVLWESDKKGPASGSYVAKLQSSDCNLVVRDTKNGDAVLWASNSFGRDNCFLGVRPSSRQLLVVEGSPPNPGKVLWDKTIKSLSSPSTPPAKTPPSPQSPKPKPPAPPPKSSGGGSAILLLERTVGLEEGSPITAGNGDDRYRLELLPGAGRLAITHVSTKTRIWQSSPPSDDGAGDRYVAKFQGDCNLIIRRGDFKGPGVWSSNSVSPKTSCYLGLLPGNNRVAIVVGSPPKFDRILWQKSFSKSLPSGGGGDPPKKPPIVKKPPQKTPSSGGQMVVFFKDTNDGLREGETRNSGGYRMKLGSDGRITLSSSSKVLWRSPRDEDANDNHKYVAKLQGDCNFVVRQKEGGSRVWQTGNGSPKSTCFFALLPDEGKVAVLEGTGANDRTGKTFWSKSF